MVAPSLIATSQSWLVPIDSRSSSCEARERGTRRLRVGAERRHGHQSGNPHRTASDELAQLGRPDAPLGLLARDVHLHQDLRPRLAVATELCQDGIAGHGVDQPHQRKDLLHLAALKVADEVPGKRIAPALPLHLQVLKPVLADQRHPPVRQGPHLVGRHVLSGGEDLHLRTGSLADPLQVGANPLRLEQTAASSSHLASMPDSEAAGCGCASHTRPAWRPVRSPSRRWEKKSSG